MAEMANAAGGLSPALQQLGRSWRIRSGGRHRGQASREDMILELRDSKRLWGDRAAAVGGIETLSLCWADGQALCVRVAATPDARHSRGAVAWARQQYHH